MRETVQNQTQEPVKLKLSNTAKLKQSISSVANCHLNIVSFFTHNPSGHQVQQLQYTESDHEQKTRRPLSHERSSSSTTSQTRTDEQPKRTFEQQRAKRRGWPRCDEATCSAVQQQFLTNNQTLKVQMTPASMVQDTLSDTQLSIWSRK